VVRLARIELAASCSAGKRPLESGGSNSVAALKGMNDAGAWQLTPARKVPANRCPADLGSVRTGGSAG